MKRFDLVKDGDEWKAKSNGRTVAGTKAQTKARALTQTTAVAKKASEPVSVRIHKADGEFQEERTYPRSADPRSSRG